MLGLLTRDSEGDHLADDAAHGVPGDALVAPRVSPRHALYLVEVLGGELGDKVPVLQPPVLGLGEACGGNNSDEKTETTIKQ